MESVPDKGSDFSVFLRLPEASMEEHADVQTQTAVKTEEADYEDAFRGRRILLAEDNEINAMIAIEILQEMGASVGDRFSSNKKAVKNESETIHLSQPFWRLVLKAISLFSVSFLCSMRYQRHQKLLLGHWLLRHQSLLV